MSESKNSPTNPPTDSSSKAQRREFLKFSGLGTVASLVGAKLFATSASVSAAEPAPSVMVKPTDPMAMSLGYIEDATKVDTKKYPKREGKEGAKQWCYNCQFYQTKDPAKAKDTKSAPCTIFQGKGVTAKGWCNTWTQNPLVKN